MDKLSTYEWILSKYQMSVRDTLTRDGQMTFI